MKREIKIAGAGIAGLTAAINLAKAGFPVTVFEKSQTSGVRFHNDFQGIENWTGKQDVLDFLKKIGISPNFLCLPFRTAEIWTANQRKFRLAMEKPAFYLVKRGTDQDSLDQGLLRQALALKNLQIKFNSPIENPGEIDIVATGPYLRDKTIDGLASGYRFNTDHSDFAVMILDDKLAPNGYGYCLISQGEGVVTTVIFRNYEQINSYREKVLKLTENNLGLKIQPKGEYGGICNFFFGRVPPNKKIYVGEAGGFQDSLWGFGMKYALFSGYSAAKSIIEGKNYYQEVANKITPQIKTSVVNRFIFSRFNSVTYLLMAKIWGSSKTPVRLLGDWYRYSKIKNLLFPLISLFYRKNIRDPRWPTVAGVNRGI